MRVLTADTLDRARGALLGLAVGDALGGPLEFLSAEQIAERHGDPVREMTGGGWLDLAPGETTDDTAMALGLAGSMADHGRYDPRRSLAAQLEWFRGAPKDVGATVSAVLRAVENGADPLVAARELHERTGRTAGNGSLMRVAPIALRYHRDRERRSDAAATESALTHFDPRAVSACRWFCDVLAALVAGEDAAELVAPEELRGAWESDRAEAALAAAGPNPGFVLATLAVASAALREAEDFEQALVWAVNLGGDSDTNGAVAGALLGARFGAASIPAGWTEALNVGERPARLAERLLLQGHADGVDSERPEPEQAQPRRRRDAPQRDPFAAVLAIVNGGGEPAAPGEPVELRLANSGAFREGPMLLSHDPDYDYLVLIDRFYTDDGLDEQRAIEVCEDAWLILDEERDSPVGFRINGISEFDFEAPQNAAVWSGPRFDVPALGLEQATMGLVAATTRIVLGSLRTPNRYFFDLAVGASGAEAAALWRRCLAEGDEMGRFALGYTLMDLDRQREAHDHLRHYTRVAPSNAWAWCWLGRCCEELEDWEGAEYAYRQAIEREEGGSFETDAPALLAEFLRRRAA